MSVIDLGRTLYKECCARHQVKPNAVIQQQLDRPDLLNLQCLDASQTFLGSKGVLAVLDVVRHHRCLRSLRLPKNGVDASCVEALSAVVQSGHPCLETLDVSDNGLSTPSARLLCETVRRCGRPTSINTDGCGLVGEWEVRLHHTLASTVELQELGFYKHGPPRPPHRWHTAFVLVMGDDTLCRRYCTQVLPAVSSYMAKHRVRVAPVTVRPDDSAELVHAKVKRCREEANADCAWGVVLIDGNAFGTVALKGAQLTALEELLAAGTPVVPPLRNKLGVVRPRVYRHCRALFAYNEMSIEECAKRGTHDLGLADWLPLAGLSADAAHSHGAEESMTAAVVSSGAAAAVRYQGDLVAAMSVLFREEDESLTTAASSESPTASGVEAKRLAMDDSSPAAVLLADSRVEEATEAPSGALHEKKSAVLMHYLLDDVKSMNVPLVLYGATDIGKGELLSCAAQELRQHYSLDAQDHAAASSTSLPWPKDVVPPSQPTVVTNTTTTPIAPYHRIVCLRVCTDDKSIVLLLYRLLALFAPMGDPHADATSGCHRNAPAPNDEAAQEYTSVAMLCDVVRTAIQHYNGPRMAVLLSRLDEADTCGFTSDVLASWLPHSFPGTLSFVVSIATESPALPLLRKRSPQPYECLVPPLSELNRVHLFKTVLQEKSVRLPGVENRRYTRRDELKAAENAFLAKESCISFLYIRLAAIYLHYLINTGLTVNNEYDVLDAIQEHLPPTIDLLVEDLCQKLATFNESTTLRYTLLCLCISPLAVTDLQVLCEDLGPCEKNTTLPTLLQLADVELVAWSDEGTISIAHRAIRDVLLRLYASDLDRVSVLVENHFHRMLTTRSMETSMTFRHLLPIMIQNGNFQVANQTVLDPCVIDFVISVNAINRYYVMDGYFRLLQARDVLTELAAMDTDGLYSEQDIDDDALRRSLRDVQRCSSGNLLQTSLLQRSATPFSSAARKLVLSSLSQLPYPVLLPTNDGDEDINDSTWDCCGTPGTSIVQCNGRGDYLIVTTEDTVIAFHVGTGQEVARLHMPFENDQPITGALMATGTRVVVVGTEQVLVWDFEGRSFFLFGEMTTTAHVSFMDAFGTTLIARHITTGALCVLDVTRKMVVCDIPSIAEEPVRKAIFCGNCVLVVSTNGLFLFDSAMETYTTMVHTGGTVRSVACNPDGRLVASTVGSTLFVWTARGDLLHRIEVGNSPITGLHFDPAGTLLLTRQAEGSALWRTLTGTCVTALTNPLGEEEVNYTTFTQDGTRLLGRSGNRLIVWEAQHCTPLGVYTAPTGVYTYIHEVDNELFCATSTGIVKRYTLQGVIPSVESSRAGALSTNWRQNAKISPYAVEAVCVGESDYVVALDARKGVHVYHRKTGKRTAHAIGNARCIAAYGTHHVATVPERTLCLSLFDLVQCEERQCAFPREVVAESEVSLFVSTSSEGGLIGVTCFVPGHSTLLIVRAEDCTLLCTFTAHTSRSLHGFFLGSFVYSAGKDGSLGVWNLPRRAQRASFQHPRSLVAATSSPANGIFLVMDTEGHFLQAHVDKITSTSRAAFVVQSLSTPHLTRYVQANPIATMRLCGSHILLTTQAGCVVLSKREGVRHINEVSLRSAASCTETVAVDGSQEIVVLTGHCDGRVLSSRLLVPCYQRPGNN